MLLLEGELVQCSQFSNWLQAGQLRGQSSSPGRVKNFLHAIQTHLLTIYTLGCLSGVSLCLLLLCFCKPGTISSRDQESPGEGCGLFSLLFLSNLSPWK
jgi:hypothetical protein